MSQSHLPYHLAKAHHERVAIPPESQPVGTGFFRRKMVKMDNGNIKRFSLCSMTGHGTQYGVSINS
jgi:hypothetical protein